MKDGNMMFELISITLHTIGYLARPGLELLALLFGAGFEILELTLQKFRFTARATATATATATACVGIRTSRCEVVCP